MTNILFMTVLQASSTSAAGGGTGMLITIILLFAIMWLFMIRPQRKQQKALDTFRAGLKKGDKVVTAGGIYGTVDEVDDTTVLLKVDGDVKIRFDKASIARNNSAPAK